MVSAKHNLNLHLEKLNRGVKKLERYKKMLDRQSFLDNEMAVDAVCKALEETIEIMLTVGNMIIAERGYNKPEKNDDIFQILADSGVYSKKLAEKLWGLGGFRNILVHNYIDLDLNLVYDHLEAGIPIFKEYVKNIAKYLVRK